MEHPTDELWWDHALLLEHFATILLEAARKHRKHGIALSSHEVADQMEECAWEMLSVDMKFGEEQKHVDRFCEIMKKHIREWWD